VSGGKKADGQILRCSGREEELSLTQSKDTGVTAKNNRERGRRVTGKKGTREEKKAE